MFSKLQFTNAINAVKNPLSKIKASIKDMITKQKVQITQVIPNKLYHISPPSPQNIQSLLQLFKTSHQFQIWNIGQYSYSQQILTKLLDGRQRNSDGKQIVYNLTYEYFANIPFCQMIKTIQSIENFLSMSPSNKVYIHCQDNKRRSAVFLACYIFLSGFQTDIVKSILTIKKALNISIQDKQISQNNGISSGSIYKSQHLVLKNLMNYINNSSFINKNGWNLKKLLINNAPKIHLVLKLDNKLSDKQTQIKFKVLLQIRSAQGICYKKIFQDQFIEGQSLCLRIPESQTVVLKDDFLIIVKYVYQKKGYSVLRSQLNTNFIYDQYFRVQRNDMDLSIINSHPSNNSVFMDLLLQMNQSQQSDLSKLNILKENLENQNQIQIQKKEGNKKSLQANNSSHQKKQQQQQQDGFGILDEQQEAEHNQKMQRQIEQQLARELQNIRKKRTPQVRKTDDINVQQNKQTEQKQILINSNQQQIMQKQQQRTKLQVRQQIQTEQLQKQNQQIKQNKFKIIEIKENDSPKKQKQNQVKKISIQKAQVQQQQSNQSSQGQSSQQQQSSSNQGEQPQDQDLDDYLTKLQKQAEKHD